MVAHAGRSTCFTDALTKLLMPGTSIRDTSACVIKNKMLV
jgi:hypothetical protein